jgi:hypothetical protein
MTQLSRYHESAFPALAFSTHRKDATMTDVIQLRPASTEPEKPPKIFGNDDWLLRMCTQWRAARAQQQKNWAEHEEATMFGFLDDRHIKLDTDPLCRMKQLECDIADMEPRTIILARELLGVAATILAHSIEHPEATLSDGPILEIIVNVKNALEHCDGKMPIGPKPKSARRGH